MRVPNVDSYRIKVEGLVRASCMMRWPVVDPDPVLKEIEGMKLPTDGTKLITLLDALISTQVDEAVVDGYDPYGLLVATGEP